MKFSLNSCFQWVKATLSSRRSPTARGGEGIQFNRGDTPSPSSIHDAACDVSEYRLSPKLVSKQMAYFDSRRKYKPEVYADLLSNYTDSHESLRLCDFVHQSRVGGRKILLIRHDVDHDHLTALKIAHWEHERGLRATYCLLHTAYYYGKLEGGRYRRTIDLIETAQELVSLGHEVNLHNNLVALALTADVEPALILKDELEFFRGRGVPIVGTSSHGDRLCREVGFLNLEIFKECCEGAYGKPREVRYTDPDGVARSVMLGQLAMGDFDLEYEAYDIPRDVYHSESGGNLRTALSAPGRLSYRDADDDSGQVVGVLTHPVWWDFSGL